MPLIPTKHDNRIQRLRERIDKPGQQRGAQRQLNRSLGRQYFARQRNRPETPLPYSGEYETTVGRLNRDRDEALSGIAGQRLATEQQYGFGADTSNPFSQARLLERQYAQQRNRSTNTYATQGQLYSGALSNQRASDQFSGQHALDTALREYQSRLGDLTAEELKAQRGYEEGVSTAEAKRLEEALQTPVDPSEAPPRSPQAKKLLDKIRQNQKQQRKKGHAGKARKIRERLDRLQDLPLG